MVLARVVKQAFHPIQPLLFSFYIGSCRTHAPHTHMRRTRARARTHTHARTTSHTEPGVKTSHTLRACGGGAGAALSFAGAWTAQVEYYYLVACYVQSVLGYYLFARSVVHEITTYLDIGFLTIKNKRTAAQKTN
jgi:hypothetical protein